MQRGGGNSNTVVDLGAKGANALVAGLGGQQQLNVPEVWRHTHLTRILELQLLPPAPLLSGGNVAWDSSGHRKSWHCLECHEASPPPQDAAHTPVAKFPGGRVLGRTEL